MNDFEQSLLQQSDDFRKTSDALFDFVIQTDFKDAKVEQYFLRSVGFDLSELNDVFLKRCLKNGEDYYQNYFPFLENMYKKSLIYQKYISQSRYSLASLAKSFEIIDSSLTVPLPAEQEKQNFLDLQQSYYAQIASDNFKEIEHFKIVDEEKLIEMFK